ncbi:hypothetical protein Dda_4336 [Drechslerella dactyloides]|uniref:F-box domain-containing protein n=1 Tax=Drechslerella dactyloides TaxID=74499 RepID=A0AAD6IYY3_DREDA|nr:hypothetical protein Dda_4336 [Drechslerella dactyloides]
MGASHSSNKARKALRTAAASPDPISPKKQRLLSTLSKMGYDSLPLEIELKILEEIEWTETVACSQVCTRWRDQLARAKAHNRRYLPDRQPAAIDGPKGGSNNNNSSGRRAKHQSGSGDLSTSFGELTVTIASDEATPLSYAEDVNTGGIPQSAVLGRGSVVLLHRFMHEAEQSFGFFVKVDPAVRTGLSSNFNINPPEGFFLIGNEQLHSHANSLGGRPGILTTSPETATADTASTSETSTIDSASDDDAPFAGGGRVALQLSRRWQWSEPLFNSPMCDTEVHYGRGFETFKRIRRNTPYNHRTDGGNNGRYLRRLSELDLAEGETCVTVRQLVAAISRSVRTIKMLEPEAREQGGVFFVKFDGVRIQEYMKYVPHGFFDFQTGGKIELEIYDGVHWVA